MAADLREMQEIQGFSEKRIDKTRFVELFDRYLLRGLRRQRKRFCLPMAKALSCFCRRRMV